MLKPRCKVVTPREDLREGKPFAASEFAVQLDQVREGRASADYQKPERFSAPYPSHTKISAVLTACWRGRKDWDFKEAHQWNI